MCLSRLLNLFHKNFKKIRRQIEIIVSTILNIFGILKYIFIKKHSFYEYILRRDQ